MNSTVKGQRVDYPFKVRRRRAVLFFCGALLAVISAEAILSQLSRPFAFYIGHYDFSYRQPTADVTLDQRETAVYEYREGIARTHFTAGGARITGNGSENGAPNVLIIGDSFVEALQIGDSETMGSVLERALRSRGTAVNVRQYGWGGASTPDYVTIAKEMKRAIRPQSTIVLIKAADVGRTETPSARIVEVDGVLVGQQVPRAESFRSIAQHRIGVLSRKSSLLYSLLLKFALDFAPAARIKPANADSLSMPASEASADKVVGALQLAYGPSLLIVYISQLKGDELSRLDPAETMFLEGCVKYKIDCASTRDSFERSRANKILVRGFHNTAPEEGHLNAAGHRIVARIIESWMVRK